MGSVSGQCSGIDFGITVRLEHRLRHREPSARVQQGQRQLLLPPEKSQLFRLKTLSWMAKVTHLLHDCSASDIVAEIEVHGAVVVDDFVMPSWLAAFNASVQTSIGRSIPFDYVEPDAMDFLGHNSVRLNGLVSKASHDIELMLDPRLLGVMDQLLAPSCG